MTGGSRRAGGDPESRFHGVSPTFWYLLGIGFVYNSAGGNRFYKRGGNPQRAIKKRGVKA